MNKKSGFVYILYNASYMGVLKIGKTTKDPEERAKELSSATGVATPFVVVYQRSFKNCHKAEELIHQILSDKGYRINENREFFKLSMTEAINTLIGLPDIDAGSQEEKNTREQSMNKDDLGRICFEKGLLWHTGENNHIIDYEEAIAYFKKAIKLGYTKAYRQLGQAYHHKGNTNSAIKSLLKGIDNGDFFCYIDLIKIYQDNPYKKNKKYVSTKNETTAWDILLKYIDEIDLDNVNNINSYLDEINYICFYYVYSVTLKLIYPLTYTTYWNSLQQNEMELVLSLDSLKQFISPEWERVLSKHKCGIIEYVESNYPNCPICLIENDKDIMLTYLNELPIVL